MAVEDMVDPMDASTTRRTVVKTGVKLAYAAPLVAASFKLTATAASAQAVSGGCGTASICLQPSFGNCTDGCVCIGAFNGGTTCVEPRPPARGVVFCPGGVGCIAGEVCVVGTCAQQPVCAPACGAGIATLEDGPSLFEMA